MPPLPLLIRISAVGLFVSTLAVHVIVGKRLATHTSLMRRVGIVRTDWWFAFHRGLWRLAFGNIGAELPNRDRLWLRLFWSCGILFFIALLLFLRIPGAAS